MEGTMARSLRAWAAACAVAVLVGCGGGAGTPDVQHERDAPALSVQRAAARVPDATALMDWAERAYPQFFPSHRANQSLAAYVYRYYPETGAYLGVVDQQVVVLNVLGPQIVTVGQLSDFACQVYPDSCTVISGVAAKGLLEGAAVSLYELRSDGSKGSLLASGVTASDGSFSLTLAAPPVGAVLVEAVGGRYTSGYDGRVVTSSTPVSAALRSVPAGGVSGVSVNTLSDMSLGLARRLLQANASLQDALYTGEMWVAWAYGLSTAPNRVVPRFRVDAAGSDNEGLHLALALAAIDTLGHRLSPSDPDAIHAALAADFADGSFDGWNNTTRVRLGGAALPADTGTGRYVDAFALSFSALTAGWRPAYVEAHYAAGTLVEAYRARLVRTYVAAELQPYFPPRWTSPVSRTASLDASATGYSCSSGTLTFDANGTASCGGPYYTCFSGTLVMTNGNASCSDGSIAVYHAATIPTYTAPTIAVYTAQSIQPYQAAPIVGRPAEGTIPIFRATAVRVFTQAERDAMMANDRAAGDAAAARVSSLGTPTALQLDWMQRINDAVIASVSH
jgi:hypothetical protein